MQVIWLICNNNICDSHWKHISLCHSTAFILVYSRKGHVNSSCTVVFLITTTTVFIFYSYFVTHFWQLQCSWQKSQSFGLAGWKGPASLASSGHSTESSLSMLCHGKLYVLRGNKLISKLKFS